jgi:energy-converting hydrogenase Eha subunit F
MPSLAVTIPRLSQPTTYQPVSAALIPPSLPSATIPQPNLSIGTTISQQLPLPHVRAMSTVFNPSSTWPQSIPSAAAVAPTVTQTTNPLALYNASAVSLPDPGRRQSPYTTANVSSDSVSPSSAYAIHTPQNHLSPSFFLVNRNSPYRPVRAVNTLLIPPPSASLHQPRHLSIDQMHYQPLGKNFTERRTGILPYLHHDGLPQGVIPSQPNFLPSQF